MINFKSQKTTFKYTFLILVFGVLGTIMVNILRITLIILIFRWLGQKSGLIFHDYSALLTNTLWLVLFWWVAFEFVLEEKVADKLMP